MDQKLVIDKRARLEVDGISEILALSDKEVLLLSGEDKLCVKGEGLKVLSFDNVGGSFVLTGKITGVAYADNTRLIKKLFR